MSVVLTWKTPQFAAIACDGRLSRRGQDGNLAPVCEFYRKFLLLTDEIVFGCTGSKAGAEAVTATLRSLVEALRGDPQLFGTVAALLPTLLRGTMQAMEGHFIDGIAGILMGYDCAEKRIRGVSYISDENFVPVESPDWTIEAIGNREATKLVPEALNALRLTSASHPPLQEILPAMQRVIQSTAERIPWTINGNVWAYLITVPELKEEQRAKGLARACQPSMSLMEADGSTFRRLLYVNPDNTFHASTVLNSQASILPITTPNAALSISWKATIVTSAPTLHMTWAGFTINYPDGSTISVPASTSYATPAAPALSQAAGGSLASRSRFVRIALVRLGAIMAVGPETGLTISANNLLTVASPASVAGYDGWIPLASGVTLAESMISSVGSGGTSAISPIAFGANWTEPSTGLVTTGNSISEFLGTASSTLTGLLILGNTANSTTYDLYPAYEPIMGNLVFPDGIRSSSGDSVSSAKMWADSRVPLQNGPMQSTSPASGGSSSGSGGGGRGTI